MRKDGETIKILFIDDDKRICEAVASFLSPQYNVFTAHDSTEGHRLLSQLHPDLLLLDHGLPGLSGLEVLKILRRRIVDLPIIMLTGESAAETIIEVMKAGATDYIIKGTDDFEATLAFRIDQALKQVAILRKNRKLEEESFTQAEKNKKLADKLAVQAKNFEILGSSENILNLKRDISRLKGTDAFVIINGENGTGKELVARNLNLQEEDPSRPFIAINCAAIPTTLFESEFFGHVKGAFTGATENKIGQFKMADGGDIFLDEIGEVPLAMQAKLLRVLQEKTFTPVGGTKPISVDVRVIAATNRNLEDEIKRGNFREDLFYRLSRIIVNVPPLRDRSGDIVPLAEEFLKRLLPMARLSEPSKKILETYPWRGNIRELQNAIERASIFVKDSRRPVLKPEHLGLNTAVVIPLDNSMGVPEGLLPQNREGITALQRQKAIDWVDRLYWERSLKILGDNRSLYTLLEVSKTYFYERKKELFEETEKQEGTIL